MSLIKGSCFVWRGYHTAFVLKKKYAGIAHVGDSHAYRVGPDVIP